MNTGQFQRLRNRGVEVIAPTYTRTFFAILDGVNTVRKLVLATQMVESTVSGHLKRLRGWGLVEWDADRGSVIRPLFGVAHVLDDESRGEDTIAVVFASAAGQEFPDEPDVVITSREVITDVRQLRKGDMLTVAGRAYPVKEVRIGRKVNRASVRLALTKGEFWHKCPLDVPIEGRRTIEGEQRLGAAIEPRDGRYDYGR
jgi:DNA-binding transcriptional ArsR family regulator